MTTDTIARLLAHWGLPGATDVRPFPRGTNNTVWDIDGSFVLRRYDTLPDERIVAEHRLLNALSAAELPFAVPVPIPALDGRTTVERYTLFPRLPGEPADRAHLAPAAAALAQLDRVLATIPSEFAPYDWRDRIHPAVPDLADLAGELAKTLPGHAGVQWFRGLASAHSDRDLPRQIVHGDWALSNVLVEGGRITAALDFEVAGLSVRLDDLAAAFYNCVDRNDMDQVNVFCQAYLAAIDISDAEREAFPDLLRRRAFGRVVWRAGRWRRGQDDLGSIARVLQQARELEDWLAAAPNPLLVRL